MRIPILDNKRLDTLKASLVTPDKANEAAFPWFMILIFFYVFNSIFGTIGVDPEYKELMNEAANQIPAHITILSSLIILGGIFLCYRVNGWNEGKCFFDRLVVMYTVSSLQVYLLIGLPVYICLVVAGGAEFISSLPREIYLLPSVLLFGLTAYHIRSIRTLGEG